MPILPENKLRYPKDWADISHRIRFVRAGGRCEWKDDGVRCEARHGKEHPVTGAIVVLTTAHLDHTPENCDEGNLMAMCQLHHNRYDAKHRRETRKVLLNGGQYELFPGPEQMTIAEVYGEIEIS